ncbi:hypothetical protein ACEQ8H_007749 [Pleosporales sp. CAS-2024a]
MSSEINLWQRSEQLSLDPVSTPVSGYSIQPVAYASISSQYKYPTPTYDQPASVQPAQRHLAVSSIRGKTVEGSYNPTNPAPDSHYETLDASYYVRDVTFFNEGRLFAVLFTEAAGEHARDIVNKVTDYNTSLSLGKYEEGVHSQVCKFVVVRRKREYCYVV